VLRRPSAAAPPGGERSYLRRRDEVDLRSRLIVLFGSRYRLEAGARSPALASAVESAMADLSAFPITRRWPAQHPDRLQLYSFPTPNGVKVSATLEELGLAYEPHRIDIISGDTRTPEYLSLNPNGKIPAIIDPDGPGGK